MAGPLFLLSLFFYCFFEATKRINRPRFHYESGWVQSSSVLIHTDISLRSAYSDTAAVTSELVCDVVNCNKLNKVICDFSSSYTAPTALGIRQEFEQIRANVFLFNVFFYFCIERY